MQRFLALSREQRTPALVQSFYGLMVTYGSIEFDQTFGAGIAAAAEGAFDEAFASMPESDDRTFLRELIPWMLDRRW